MRDWGRVTVGGGSICILLLKFPAQSLCRLLGLGPLGRSRFRALVGLGLLLRQFLRLWFALLGFRFWLLRRFMSRWSFLGLIRLRLLALVFGDRLGRGFDCFVLLFGIFAVILLSLRLDLNVRRVR